MEYACQQSIILTVSLANKIDNQFQILLIQKLNFILIAIIMIFLIVFRREQKKLDAHIDESQLTPSDYTILVRNIPKTLPVNYRWELTNMFQNYACADSSIEIKVTKVVLVYDTTELHEIDEKIHSLIDKKKQTLQRTKMNFSGPDVLEIDLEIKLLQEKVEQIEEDYFYTNKKFAGVAFISFQSEDMKDQVLEQNKHTLSQRIKSYFYSGKLPDLEDGELQWHAQKIFVEPAPEPNDVDWEFIHIVTTDKIFSRIKAFILTLILQSGTFLAIYIISYKLILMTDEMHEQQLKGSVDQSTGFYVRLFSYSISFTIVLFNKFFVGFILHKITDLEKISTKTKFQISFAKKLTSSLFMNAAIISYIIDILIFKNLYGFGGFIFNESMIFVLNALLPPLIWLIDPWTLLKNYKRDVEVDKGSDCLLTQQEANFLMEQVDYLPAKRYADIIKTMWFTFFFGTAIPIGVFSSLFGLILYYLVDKFNLLRRRTVKESISKELSLEMISMLEHIVVFGPLGCLTVSYSFYQRFEQLDIIQLIFALVYTMIPFDQIIDTMFPISNKEEPISYEIGCVDFDTDYDRENPITRRKAIQEFALMKECLHAQQKTDHSKEIP